LLIQTQRDNEKNGNKHQYRPENYREKVVGHICWMRDDRLLNKVVFGKSDGKNKNN